MSLANTVEKLKEQGNEAMRKGSHDAAIALYTQVLALDATHVPSLTNRALAYLKTHRFDECVADCTAALKLDAANVKALFRRASAFKELRRPEAALTDLAKLATIEPDNVVARELANQLKWSAKSAARADRLAAKATPPPLVEQLPDEPVQPVVVAAPVVVAPVTPVVASKPIQVVPSGDADRVLARAAPSNTAQYEALVSDLFATALERPAKLARLFGFVRQLADVGALFTAEMDESALATTIEAVAAHAAEQDAAFCSAFLSALHSMPRFDLFSMCLDDATRSRLDSIAQRRSAHL